MGTGYQGGWIGHATNSVKDFFIINELDLNLATSWAAECSQRMLVLPGGAPGSITGTGQQHQENRSNESTPFVGQVIF
jgi:hypothetical protein